MPIEFRCQSCGKLLRTPDESAGKSGRCPHCKGVMQIPLGAGVGNPAPETAAAPQSAPALEAGRFDIFATPGAANPGPAPAPATHPAPAPSASDPMQNLFGEAPLQAPAGGSYATPGFPAQSYPAQGFPAQGFPAAQYPAPGFAPAAQPAGYAASQYNNPYTSPAAATGLGGYGGYGSALPHRGGLILGLGIAGLVLCCCPVFGMAFSIPAWLMGRNDLAAIERGRMDPTGRGNTQTGMYLGLGGLVLSVLWMITGIILQLMGALAQDGY